MGALVFHYAAPRTESDMTTTCRILALTVPLVLCGCGGGGSDASPAPAVSVPASVDAGAAWTVLLHTNKVYSVSGKASDGQLYALSYTVTPGPTGSVASGKSDAVGLSTSLQRNGVLSSSSAETLYLYPGSGRVTGYSRPNADCALISSGAEPSRSAALGQSGALFSGHVLPGCFSTALGFEDISATWSIESEGSTVYFCDNITDKGAVIASTTQLCVQVNAAGTLGAAVRVMVNNGTGLTVVMR